MVRRDETGFPDYPTCLRARLPGGRLVGTDGSMWMYRAVPLNPVLDASTSAEGLAAGDPLFHAFEELASITSVGMARRSTAKGGYRQVHLLLVNVPMAYRPPAGHPLSEYLSASYSDQSMDRRVLLFGVQLQPKVTSRGLRAAVRSVADTILVGGAPIEDFDADAAVVSGALGRAGLSDASDEDLRLANAWWTHGDRPDVPMLEHADHLHLFMSGADAARAADAGGSCNTPGWEALDQHAVTFVSVQDFETDMVPGDSPAAWWAARLLAQGALAISIRGGVEPSKVTRAELRRRKRQFMEDINEAAQNGKMERAEQTEALELLSATEAAFASGGAPSVLTDASVVAALSGRIADISQVSAECGLKLNTMDYRQLAAMSECWPCSNIRANPHLHDIPVQSIAYSGLPSISRVGDGDGAQIGFTEGDRQIALVSPTAASSGDAQPLMVIPGQTGSGKLLTLDTPIPTPAGWTTMGELAAGDEVIGRDGRPCRVTFLSDIVEEPDLYRITFSDGQVVDADAEHQWVVSTFQDRCAPKGPNRIAAQTAWDDSRVLIERLESVASLYPADEEMDSAELLAEVHRVCPTAPWRNEKWLGRVLDFVGCPSSMAPRSYVRSFSAPSITKTDPVVLFPVAATVEANLAAWRSASGGNARRWAASLASNIKAAEAVLEASAPDEWATIRDIGRRLEAAGSAVPAKHSSRLAKVARGCGIESKLGQATVTVPLPDTSVSTRDRRVWPVSLAFKALATRVRQQHGDRPSSDVVERRMTTFEMIEAGVVAGGGQSNFSVTVPGALSLPEADLPVDPYVLGAWLGDGSTGSGSFTQDPVVRDGRDDSDFGYLLSEIASAGYPAQQTPSSPKTIGTQGLLKDLRTAGVLLDKHIPVGYLRASQAQRIALLQGLMDTDGTIDASGACELSLCNERLAADALELIRSLGIKCSMTSGPASITEDDPDNPGQKRRRVTGTRWRMHFTTTTQVFRLPRKAGRVPTSTRETQKRLYITSIVPITPRPGRCIQVDSADHTYLCAGFVPTSNTMAMLWVADQFARMGSPVVIIDPKMASSHDAVALSSGGQVASLDDLTKSDGIFDPISFARTPTAAAEMASAMLMSVNPWGDNARNLEVPLITALDHGIRNGATCIGEALQMAQADGRASADLVQPVLEAAGASAMFRACVGMTRRERSLAIADGITLIKVGDAHLDLPEPGVHPSEMSLQQRVALSLVRMMVFGSAYAVTGRKGVVMLDEAWVFLGAGKTEVERLGRLARSQGVLPMLFTQRVSDALNAGLRGYISRGLILPMSDPVEAAAACELFELEATADRMSRITAKATIGGTDGSPGAPNWHSMRALRDPRTGRTLRGSVGIYADLHGRAVPVEVAIPPGFLEIASTNPDDIRRRQERLALASEAGPDGLGTDGVDAALGLG